MGTILRIPFKLNLTPNTLSCYRLIPILVIGIKVCRVNKRINRMLNINRIVIIIEVFEKKIEFAHS